MQYEKDELIDKLKELIDIMNKSGLNYLKVKNDDFEAELGCKPKDAPVAMPMPVPVPQAQSVTVNAAANTESSGSPAEKCEEKAIKSPIVGTFYSASMPGKPAFVKVGDTVNEGDVVCIIESMKVMNEIQADCSGVVEKIEVTDGATVEYGQPLIILK